MFIQHHGDRARKMLSDWKEGNYAFGTGALTRIGDFAQKVGKSTILVVTGLGVEKWTEPLLDEVRSGDFHKIKNVPNG